MEGTQDTMGGDDLSAGKVRRGGPQVLVCSPLPSSSNTDPFGQTRRGTPVRSERWCPPSTPLPGRNLSATHLFFLPRTASRTVKQPQKKSFIRIFFCFFLFGRRRGVVGDSPGSRSGRLDVTARGPRREERWIRVGGRGSAGCCAPCRCSASSSTCSWTVTPPPLLHLKSRFKQPS